MSENEFITLRTFRCLRNLQDGDLQPLDTQLERLEFSPGSVLFQQGSPGEAAYLVTGGTVEIRVEVPDLGERVFATLDPGAVFGEIGLLLYQPRTASAHAVRRTSVLRLPREVFLKALERGERWAQSVLHDLAVGLARRLSVLDEQLAGLLATLPATGAYHGDDEARATAATHLSQRTISLNAGEVVFRQGDAGDGAFLVNQGSVGIWLNVPGAEPHRVYTIDPGSIFGEVGLLLDEARTATARTDSRATLTRIPKDRFDAGLASGDSWTYKFLLLTAQGMARRLAASDQQMVGLIKTVQEGNDARRNPAEAAELAALRERLLLDPEF